MSLNDSFVRLMARLRAGDSDAETAVWQRFTDRLIRLAHSQLATWIRHKVEPEDVVQSVFKSFFRRYGRGKFDFSKWDDLWSLLALSTVWKCRKRVQYLQAACRDHRREVPLEPTDDDFKRQTQALDREPNPEDVVILTELVELLLRGLDADDRKIVELLLQGYTVAEISEQLGPSPRTVQRVRERARKRLEQMAVDDMCES